MVWRTVPPSLYRNSFSSVSSGGTLNVPVLCPSFVRVPVGLSQKLYGPTHVHTHPVPHPGCTVASDFRRLLFLN